MGEKVKHLRGAEANGRSPLPQGMADGVDRIDHERAAQVLPVLAQILGVKLDGDR